MTKTDLLKLSFGFTTKKPIAINQRLMIDMQVTH